MSRFEAISNEEVVYRSFFRKYLLISTEKSIVSQFEIFVNSVSQNSLQMEYTELDHLKDKDPVVPAMYKKLIRELQKFGTSKIEPKKTSIHLGNRFGFAGVYTRNDYINLEVHLNYKLTSKRVYKAEQASTNRFHHTIKLSAVKDIDKELLNWLREAYELKK